MLKARIPLSIARYFSSAAAQVNEIGSSGINALKPSQVVSEINNSYEQRNPKLTIKVVQKLDDYVIGQSDAKRGMSFLGRFIFFLTFSYFYQTAWCMKSCCDSTTESVAKTSSLRSVQEWGLHTVDTRTSKKTWFHCQWKVIPKNILMIGPTGCGKTEIARRLSLLSQAPFIKVYNEDWLVF